MDPPFSAMAKHAQPDFPLQLWKTQDIDTCVRTQVFTVFGARELEVAVPEIPSPQLCRESVLDHNFVGRQRPRAVAVDTLCQTVDKGGLPIMAILLCSTTVRDFRQLET